MRSLSFTLPLLSIHQLRSIDLAALAVLSSDTPFKAPELLRRICATVTSSDAMLAAGCSPDALRLFIQESGSENSSLRLPDFSAMFHDDEPLTAPASCSSVNKIAVDAFFEKQSEVVESQECGRDRVLGELDRDWKNVQDQLQNYDEIFRVGDQVRMAREIDGRGGQGSYLAILQNYASPSYSPA